MSEEATKDSKKKKSKLPVIIVVVAVLFGGGFFGMKMKGGGAKAKPMVELGKIIELEEKLVNLTDQDTFLRTVIALHVRKDFGEEKMKDVMPAVDDAVLAVMKSKSVNQVRSEAGIEKLKSEIAVAVNKILHEVVPPEHPEPADEAEKGEKETKGEKGKDKPKEEIPDGWESAEGPVLKVYFRMFAVQ